MNMCTQPVGFGAFKKVKKRCDKGNCTFHLGKYPLVGHVVILSDYRAWGTWFGTRCGQSLYQRWCSLRTLVVDERVNQG